MFWFTKVVFAMVFAFGLAPAAAMAQRPDFCPADGATSMRIPAGPGVDMPTLLRRANRCAAPGVTITEDDVVAMNPGKIDYACYRGHGDHSDSRDPNRFYASCREAGRRRWLVTGLKYLVPLQPRVAERREDVSSSVLAANGPAQQSDDPPGADPSASMVDPTPAGPGHSVPDPNAASRREEASNDAQRRSFTRRLITSELADMRSEQRVMRKVLFIVCVAALLALFFALASRYSLLERLTQLVAFRRSGRSLAFAGTPSPAAATSSPTQPDVQAQIREAVQRAVIPVASARDAALERVKNLEADRNALAAQLDQERSRKESAPASRVSDWRAVGEPERAPKGTAQALGAALTEKLDALHRVDIDLEKKRKHLWIVENDLPSDSQRHREMAAKLTSEIQSLEDVRTVLVLAINTLTSNMYGRVFPDLLRSDKERWARINKQAVKALRNDFALGLRRVPELEVALNNAQSAEKVATDEVARQTQFREEEVARLNVSLAELRTENQRMTEALAESEESGRDQDRQIDELSSQLIGLTGRFADLEVELTTVAGERDLLKREVVNLTAMLDDQANGHGQQPNGASTRKITQPFAAVQRTPPAASGSRLPPKRGGKTDPPSSG